MTRNNSLAKQYVLVESEACPLPENCHIKNVQSTESTKLVEMTADIITDLTGSVVGGTLGVLKGAVHSVIGEKLVHATLKTLNFSQENQERYSRQARYLGNYIGFTEGLKLSKNFGKRATTFFRR